MSTGETIIMFILVLCLAGLAPVTGYLYARVRHRADEPVDTVATVRRNMAEAVSASVMAMVDHVVDIRMADQVDGDDEPWDELADLDDAD